MGRGLVDVARVDNTSGNKATRASRAVGLRESPDVKVTGVQKGQLQRRDQSSSSDLENDSLCKATWHLAKRSNKKSCLVLVLDRASERSPARFLARPGNDGCGGSTDHFGVHQSASRSLLLIDASLLKRIVVYCDPRRSQLVRCVLSNDDLLGL